VSDAVTGEIVDSFLRGTFPHQGIDGGFRTIGQEDRAGLRLHRLHVTGAVVFLHRPGQFVLANDVVLVLIDADQSDDTGLAVFSQALPVQIETG